MCEPRIRTGHRTGPISRTALTSDILSVFCQQRDKLCAFKPGELVELTRARRELMLARENLFLRANEYQAALRSSQDIIVKLRPLEREFAERLIPEVVSELEAMHISKYIGTYNFVLSFFGKPP